MVPATPCGHLPGHVLGAVVLVDVGICSSQSAVEAGPTGVEKSKPRKALISPTEFEETHAVDDHVVGLTFVPGEHTDLEPVFGEPLGHETLLSLDASHMSAGSAGRGPIGKLRDKTDGWLIMSSGQREGANHLAD
jgi:hypothetical protein